MNATDAKRADAEATSTVRLRVVCETPPPEVCEGAPTEFGVQDRSQRVHPGSPRPDGAVLHELTVTARRAGGTGKVRWKGDFVHGTSATPFVYLSWKRVGAEGSPWIRRYKLPLDGIAWADIERASRAGAAFEARVPGPELARSASHKEGWTLHPAPSA